ncbi:MAG: mannose-1-phosphate guanylyltransferase/mannose-6-phosphate isomerase [Helicobacteraceae bacterium]|jgi:mannose-1-phosphate guanylyltransferase|nr:mannose-1-phosphate guanylyltransferase/mannose-6-phosphate isomerase [Helicobacteraceae bacterium]
MTNIILCGGNGTRLWPLSRTLMPKQFVKLFDGESLFQKTVARNQKSCDAQFIVSNAEQYFLAVDQIEEMALTNYKADYLLEPAGRNTAPAIALACFALAEDEIVLVTPSDHLIKDEEAYFEVVSKAKELAASDNLVTFGITPNYPETGFGYIEAIPSVVLGDESGVMSAGLDVKSFKEKPERAVAEGYLAKNTKLKTQNSKLQYYWNSGMFCFRAGLFLEELKKHSPAIYEASLSAYNNAKIDEMIRVSHAYMTAIPEDSIDYAVMEKSDRVKVVPSDIDWSDLGSFDALYEELPQDGSGNALSTKHFEAIIEGSNNNLIVSEKLVAAIDVDDLIIIDTADALLVTRKGSSQKVKEVVKMLKERNSELPNIHVTAHRPWGTYTILDEAESCKVKRIVVKPGKRLSLQKHHHRSEHWIIVSGTATVTRGTDEFLVRPNESTYIPMGELHRLENVGKIPLVMIEAQVGEYVGEDDIVRIEDDFKRT